MCDNCYDCDTSNEHKKDNIGVLEFSLEKLINECKYVHFQSDMKNICVRQNIP